MNISVPVAFRTAEHAGVAVCLCPVEIAEVPLSKTHIVADLHPLGPLYYRHYRAWNGRLWQQSYRAVPNGPYNPDHSTITIDRMLKTEAATRSAIDIYRAAYAKGETPPSLMRRAVDRAVRHAFTSRFNLTHDLSLARVERAVPADRLIDGQIEVLAAAQRLADQSVLIEGELWVSSLGPLVEFDIDWQKKCTLRPLGKDDIAIPGKVIPLSHMQRSLDFINERGIELDLSAYGPDVIRDIVMPDTCSYLERIDGFNAAGLGWTLLHLLQDRELGSCDRATIKFIRALRQKLERHAHDHGLPLQPDYRHPFETGYQDYPDAQEIWPLLLELRRNLFGPTRDVGSVNVKSSTTLAIDLQASVAGVGLGNVNF